MSGFDNSEDGGEEVSGEVEERDEGGEKKDE
jgi:hypothetical protein